MIIPIVLFGIGTILVYAGIKGVDPREVVKDAIAGKSNPGADSWTGKWGRASGTYEPIPPMGKKPKTQKGGTISPERNIPPDGISGPDIVGV